MTNNNNGILSGIRIIELGEKRAVSLTGMLLAQQGAEVVRIVENSSNNKHDITTSILNRDKKRVHLTVSDSEDLEKLHQLLCNSDLLITYIGDPGLTELGINCSEIRSKYNPGLISCSLPGYPLLGPHDDYEFTEEEVNISSGMYETPTGIGKPAYFSFPMASTLTAFHAVNAIVMALIGRKKNACGQHIEIPVVNSAKTLQIIPFMIKSKAPICWSAFQMLSSPFMGIWRTAKGGHVYLHIGIPMHLRSIIMLLGKAGFVQEKAALKKVISKETKLEPSMVKSVGESIQIARILKKLFIKREAIYWEELLCNAGLCCNRISSLSEWLLHPQAIESGEVARVQNDKKEEINVPGPLIQLHKDNYTPGQTPGKDLESVYIIEKWQKKDSKFAKSETGKLPLEKVKVLDFSRVIAGPYAGRLFAEYGAEVLQVTFRKGHIMWEEPFLVAFSGGKDSITADLSSPEGKKAFRKIISDFNPDIVLHNFSLATLSKLEIDEATFKKINPDIIYISIGAYNTNGPWKDRVGLEWNIQAATGIVASYSTKENPKILNIPINDLSTGLIASFGGALAYYNMLNKNGGNTVSTFLSTPSLFLLLDGFNKQKTQEKKICQFFRAKDDWFLFSVKEEHFGSLFDVPDLYSLKNTNYGKWISYLQKEFKKRPFIYWKKQIEKTGCSKNIQVIKRIKVKKILSDDLKQANSLFKYKKHHVFGDVLVVDSPVHMSNTPIKEICPAHYFGMDTKKYLDEAGVTSKTLRKKLIKPLKPYENVNSFQRMKWFLGQLKWIVAFIYKKS